MDKDKTLKDDFSKASDMVSHCFLCWEVTVWRGVMYRMSEKMVVQSGRQPVVSGWCSTWRSVRSGAPLGCLLGAGLFHTFISGLREEAEGTLSEFRDDNKRGGAADKLGGRAANLVGAVLPFCSALVRPLVEKCAQPRAPWYQ